jgi:rhodanese-related sulfurtransferase
MKSRWIILTFVLFAALGLGARAAEEPVSSATNSITHVNATEAAKLLADKQVVVIDVRTQGEFDAGRIAGAKLVAISSPDFEKQLGELDRNKTYLVLCQSGGRSTRALKTFSKLGFMSVVHLDGGMNAWNKAGQPVEK